MNKDKEANSLISKKLEQPIKNKTIFIEHIKIFVKKTDLVFLSKI